MYHLSTKRLIPIMVGTPSNNNNNHITLMRISNSSIMEWVVVEVRMEEDEEVVVEVVCLIKLTILSHNSSI